ncbi:hypothetical protein GQ54DRAFT_21798 [Martensiomyces pterosporus]|nr:hypothetical protein GQ54DRAFT_21798 [Martensiomyces pterosporus]
MPRSRGPFSSPFVLSCRNSHMRVKMLKLTCIFSTIGETAKGTAREKKRGPAATAPVKRADYCKPGRLGARGAAVGEAVTWHEIREN